MMTVTIGVGICVRGVGARALFITPIATENNTKIHEHTFVFDSSDANVETKPKV